MGSGPARRSGSIRQFEGVTSSIALDSLLRCDDAIGRDRSDSPDPKIVEKDSDVEAGLWTHLIRSSLISRNLSSDARGKRKRLGWALGSGQNGGTGEIRGRPGDGGMIILQTRGSSFGTRRSSVVLRRVK